jgi:hypothetical protein
MVGHEVPEQVAKQALDIIARGLDQRIAINPKVGTRGVTEWFVTAELFQKVIQQLSSMGIGYHKVLEGVDFVLDMVRQYGPDLANIIKNIVTQGKEFFDNIGVPAGETPNP